MILPTAECSTRNDFISSVDGEIHMHAYVLCTHLRTSTLDVYIRLLINRLPIPALEVECGAASAHFVTRELERRERERFALTEQIDLAALLI